MDIKDILSPGSAKTAVPGTSKKRVLETLSAIAAEASYEIDAEMALNSLIHRERMGSTGIGDGIALPHGRIAGLNKPIAVAITCSPAIDFDAIDNQPVDVFFALLVPEHENQNYLKVLSNVASKLNDKETVNKLRTAKNDHALYEALT